MKKNIVTFVTPVYIDNENGLEFLKEAIEGMKNQTDNRWQAIFVDDCSPLVDVKKTLLKYQESDDRINTIFLDERKSTGVCRNIGIEWAYQRSSEIILYNDADDISHANRVREVKQIFENNPEVVVVYTRFDVIDENKSKRAMEEITPSIYEILTELEKNPVVGSKCWYTIGTETGYINLTSTTAVRTWLARKELFPDEFISEDSHTWFRYAVYGLFFYVESIPTLYRIPTYTKRHTSNDSAEHFYKEKVRVDIDGFKNALKMAISNGVVNENDESLIMARFLLRLSETIGKCGDYLLAHKVAMNAKETLSMF